MFIHVKNKDHLKSIIKRLEDYKKKLNGEPVKLREGCDCTHTQACKICAKSKGIDWNIIEGSQPSEA